ncbi:MAG: ParB/RepB/Spo0J family partition protein [Acidobacteria bacterium]|nr:ParB/RepB/Spo0J family partition protein [Acidobacteriota bacterium]
MVEKRPALGRGLGALIGEPLSSAVPAAGAPFEVEIDQLSPNRYQPRSRAEESGLDELARSIKASGVIQPVVVRRVEGAYQIIAGERRWRAAQLAGLTTIPVVVRDVPDNHDRKLLEWALVENLQRENLNPIEEAHAYRRLADEFQLTQEGIAAAVGKDRSSVANCLRLLKLPAEVQEDVSAGRLSMGHARAVLALETELAQRTLARDIIARGLSVRETEQVVTRTLTAPGGNAKTGATPRAVDVHTRAAQDKMRMTLGTRVDIIRRGRGGAIRIAFKNEDELQRLYEALTRRG